MNIKKKITGAFDLVMLFGRGMEAFSGGKREALLSLVIPAALFPFSLVFSASYPPKGMEKGYSLVQVLTTVSLQAVISTIISIVLVVGLAWGFGKLDKFWLYFEASNWVSGATFLVALPFVIAASMGWVHRDEMDRVFVLILCYFYVVNACIFFRAFQLNWQLAGFLAIITLFANEITWTLLFKAQGIAMPW